MTDPEFLRRLDEHMARGNEHMARGNEHMARGNEHMARGNELMEEIRTEIDLSRRQYRELHAITLREAKLNRAAIQETRAATRELVAALREDRELIRDIRHGIQANTESLLRVLDELRRGDGPSPSAA